jgi:type I restriction enzyme S subunit
MTAATSNQDKNQLRTYRRADSAVFLKTKEKYGGLSNMAGGFPLVVNDIKIRTSEALYQAYRFPHIPDVQRLIIEQKSPMTAKMKGKPHRQNSRPDWDAVRVKIMRWCLQVKLAQNWDSFSELLLETANLPIVEQSRRDDFWGAKPVDKNTLIGVNALGRLLMELRKQVKDDPSELLHVDPLPIPNFLLYERQIEVIGDTEVIGGVGSEQLSIPGIRVS